VAQNRCYRFGAVIENEMKQLEKKLKELQKQGYEQVTIIQLLNWIYDIQRENRLKRVRSTDR
jgi:hypothetical protein